MPAIGWSFRVKSTAALGDENSAIRASLGAHWQGRHVLPSDERVTSSTLPVLSQSGLAPGPGPSPLSLSDRIRMNKNTSKAANEPLVTPKNNPFRAAAL